ncbi:MAG TPA: hypothetical protein DIT25_01345 [Candidatus Moranbacteria bacterium]|nr:hypothetical protein [Candidatus Moranbacteria bacterium]
MLDKKLKEALELLGGKAILEDDHQLYVLMTLREFKKIKQDGIEGLTKHELVDKINNDIAIWRVAQEEEELAKINLEELEEADETEPEEIRYEKPLA